MQLVRKPTNSFDSKLLVNVDIKQLKMWLTLANLSDFTRFMFLHAINL